MWATPTRATGTLDLAVVVALLADLGETELEVTQIGKQCPNDCEIKRTTGKCVMPTEGIFAIVIKEGRIQAGDEIEVLKK